MGAVDDPSIIRWFRVGLRTELKSKVLDEVGRRSTQGFGNRFEVDDNGLDTVALAFDLGLESLHLVAIEGIADIPADINVGHDDGLIERAVHENEAICDRGSERVFEAEFL